MSKYKTKLEEFTLDELQRMVIEAPEEWEEYHFETESYYPLYSKDKRSSQFIVDGSPMWTHASSFHYTDRGNATIVQITNRMLFLKLIGVNIYSEKVPTVGVEISEFVNEVKFVDGKIYLDMDKQDIEGVIKMLKEIRGGEEN